MRSLSCPPLPTSLLFISVLQDKYIVKSSDDKSTREGSIGPNMCSNVQHPLAMVGVVISVVLQKLLHSLALYFFAVHNTNVGG